MQAEEKARRTEAEAKRKAEEEDRRKANAEKASQESDSESSDKKRKPVWACPGMDTPDTAVLKRQRKESERQRKESERLAKRLQAELDAVKVTFPETWTAQKDDCGNRGDIEWWRSGRQLVDVDSTTDEWARVNKLLTASLPSATLVKVERWENRILWQKYWEQKQKLEVNRPSKVNEKWLWHGTGGNSPLKVLEHEVGLDPRFSSEGAYGTGLYLAECARYSNHDQYVHRFKGPYGPRQLLLCRAAFGVWFDYGEETNKTLKFPPKESDNVWYDSVRGGPHRPTRSVRVTPDLSREAGDGDSSPMFVLYDTGRAYPEYIVSYKLTGDTKSEHRPATVVSALAQRGKVGRACRE
jgi:hypothetical protein